MVCVSTKEDEEILIALATQREIEMARKCNCEPSLDRVANSYEKIIGKGAYCVIDEAGYMIARPHKKSLYGRRGQEAENEIDVATFFVVGTQRRSGVGERLIRKMMDVIPDGKTLYASISNSCTDSQRMFRNEGFKASYSGHAVNYTKQK